MAVVKVNDNGTPEFTDDSLLSGATFELRLDDGDAVYEPGGDDAPVLQTVTTGFGFASFGEPAEFGRYWITESGPPPGFDTAPPLLVPYELSGAQQNCVISQAVSTCIPDDDLTGGLVLAFIENSPLGAGLPDTDLPPSSAQGNQALWWALGALTLIGGLSVAFVRSGHLVSTQPHRRDRPPS